MKNNINIEKIVVTGANFLTSKMYVVGIWPEKIDLDILDMSSPTKDILGQLLENRYRAIVHLGLCQGTQPIRPEILGLIPSILFSANELTTAWKKLIPEIISEINSHPKQ
jgi:hypothetical protein